MKIAIDARMYQQSGVGRYIRNLIYHLEKIDRKNEYYILLNSLNYDTLVYHNQNFKKILVDVGWYGLKEQIELPKILNRINPDLVHFPHFNVPIFYNKMFIVTIHDLIHQHFQMKRATTHDPLTYKLKQLGYSKVFNTAISRSLKVITVSEFVKNQLVKEAGVDPQKIIVAHEAVDAKIISIVTKMDKKKAERIIKLLDVKSPFIFYIGNAHPHKNIEGLIKAFLQLRKSYQYLSLVLAGGKHYFWQQIKGKYKHPDIHYLGQITDEQLVAIYKNAKAFVMPSFEEGFGIPLLEAMACGCPVASSDAASLPEVGGDCPIYFNPKNIGDMTEKISILLNDEKFRKVLIEKGKKRIELFSWEKLAKKTLEVYQNAGSNNSR